jgi:hypothetical protein
MNKNYCPPELLAEVVSAIKPGECLQFDKDDDCDLIIKKCPDGELERLSQDVAKFHVISQHTRAGAEFFFHYLEHTYFPPDTEEGKSYEFRICRWDAPFLWTVATIPLIEKEVAYESAKAAHMRLADGIPFMCGPVIAATRPDKLTLDGITWFPLNCDRAFTLENEHDSVSYEGRGGQQDAHVEADLRVRTFLKEKFGEQGLKDYLRRMGRSE